ncbi:MAG: hypothetical protein COA57_15500 [Flavobacteriales bacterium]|nr:MAG: hypothetical protein COA57_15500 [Flavobacteriales bacterium]
MEKSIETIWKEGFLKSDALVAPKLNDLYSQKSIHIIDKFKRMFKINLTVIVVGSFLLLGASFFTGIPVMGVGFFLILSVIVIVNKRLSNGLEKIDKNVNSYQYLKTFDNWMKEQLSVNRRMARFYYPLFFLSMLLGFWFSSHNGTSLGEALVNKVILNYSDIYLVFGIPLIGILGVILVVCILAFFGAQLYKLDVNLIYSRVFKKLDEIIADMEELRS